MLLPFILAWVTSASATSCSHHHLKTVSKHNDLLLYGITQDCQMFFLRPSQLHLLATIRVEQRHSYCYPNLVQLHLKSHDTLLLLQKQASNRICTLEVHIPTPSMLFGDHLFRYSLLNSLRYSSCSHTKHNTILLEPDLSFMDSVYSNVVYLADGLSTGPSWNLLQFEVTDKGNVQFLMNVSLAAVPGEEKNQAADYVLGVDAQKDILYRRLKSGGRFDSQCSYDSLFKPESAVDNFIETPARGFATYLEAVSAEKSLLFYAESDKTVDPQITRLHVLNKTNPKQIFCLAATNFVFDFGVVSAETLKNLEDSPRSEYGSITNRAGESNVGKTMTTPKPKMLKVKTTRKTTTSTAATTTTSSLPEEPTIQSLTSEDVSAPSEDIEDLSNELEEIATSTVDPEDFDDEEEGEEEVEDDEMVKVLKSDKEIGELRVASNLTGNSTMADQAAVTSSSVRAGLFITVLCACLGESL